VEKRDIVKSHQNFAFRGVSGLWCKNVPEVDLEMGAEIRRTEVRKGRDLPEEGRVGSD
jgi:hypothetical protein